MHKLNKVHDKFKTKQYSVEETTSICGLTAAATSTSDDIARSTVIHRHQTSCDGEDQDQKGCN